MYTVWRLEMFKYRRDVTTYGLGALVLGLLALLFYRLCVDYLQMAHEQVAQSARTLSVFGEIIKPFCSWALVIFAFCIPLLTTASMSREYHQQTFMLWASSPHHALAIVLGKWLSMLALVMLVMFVMLGMIMTIGLQAKLEYGSIFTSLLAVFLVSSSFISFGLFISSMINTPLYAMGVTFVGNGLWILLEWIDPFMQQWHTLSQTLSLFGHLDYFFNGIIVSQDLAYYIAFTSFFLSLATFCVNKKMQKVSACV